MKKYLLSLALFALVIVPVTSSAQATGVGGLGSTISGSAPACPLINQTLNLASRGSSVSSLQQYLISQGYLQSNSLTGYFGTLTRQAVRNWQRANNLKAVNGIFGPESIKQLSGLCGSINNSNITINSVSGPNSLNVGQTGTWTVNATGPNGANLTYSVDWGDSPAYSALTGALIPKTSVSQTSTFTHTYTKVGTYTVKFVVKGNVDCKYPSVIGNTVNSSFAPCSTSAQSSLTVRVVGSASTQPDVTLTAYPTSIVSDGKFGTTVLSWSSINATYCNFEKQILPSAGSITVSLSSTATYSISCTGPSGSSTSNPVTVTFQLTGSQTDQPTIIIDSKTINATFNSSTGAPELRAIFHANILAGADDLYLSEAPFGVGLIQTTGRPTTDRCQTSEKPLHGAAPSSISDWNGLLIKAGQKADFSIMVSCSINQMFAGSYYGKLTNFTYRAKPSFSQEIQIMSLSDVANSQTSSMMIIGERGPWIKSSSVQVDQSSAGYSSYWITLQGERLSKLTNITVGTKSGYTPTKFSDTSATFQVRSLALGFYPVTVENVVGKSNTVYIKIIDENISSIISTRLSPSSPIERTVTSSATQVTPDVVLGVFSLKLQEKSGTINSLNFKLNPNANGLQNLRLVDGATKFVSSGSGSNLYSFSNMIIPLSQSQWKDLTLISDVVANIDNVTVQPTLVASSIVGVDSNFNSLSNHNALDVTANPTHLSLVNSNVICAKDIKTCPDGSNVSRTGPSCDFVCPIASPQSPCPASPVSSCVGGTNITTYNSNNCPITTCVMPTPPQNLLRNSDFSAGAANWTFTNYSSKSYYSINGGSYNVSGDGVSSGAASLTQLITVKPGYIYEYGGSIKTNLGAPISSARDNVCQIDVYSYPLDTDSISARGVTSTTDYKSTVTIPTGKTSVRLRLLAVGPINGTCNYDDLYFREAAIQPKTALIQQANQLASALAAVRAAIAALGGR